MLQKRIQFFLFVQFSVALYFPPKNRKTQTNFSDSDYVKKPFLQRSLEPNALTWK